MSDDPLVTYLLDHLAGAAAAVDLLETLRDQHAGEPLAGFAAEILADVESDRATLASLAERVGGEPSVVKETAAWIAAKVARLKLGRHVAGALGTFEALETVALGIFGKLTLWRALVLVARCDPRLEGVDFGQLAARAEAQHERVEERRLEAARAALGPGSG
jgi:hypothetical protein